MKNDGLKANVFPGRKTLISIVYRLFILDLGANNCGKKTRLF
jgi:glycerol-3-phosphate responsive antiterminator